MSARRSPTAAQVTGLKEGASIGSRPASTSRSDRDTRGRLFRYSRNDTDQWMGLGSTAEKPFIEARDEAAMLRVLVKRGEDPNSQKREVEAERADRGEVKGPKFDECTK